MKHRVVWAALSLLFSAELVFADYVSLKVDVKQASLALLGGNALGNVGGAGFPPPKGPLPGPPPGNFMGNAGFMGFMGGAGNSPGKSGDGMDQEHLWLNVYLEIKGKHDPNSPVINNQFGSNTYIPIDSRTRTPFAPFVQTDFIKKTSPNLDFVKQIEKLKNSTDVKAWVNLASYAWSHGLMKKFHETMDEIKRIDAKHPVVVSYRKIKSQLKNPLSVEDPALKSLRLELKAEGYHPMPSDQGHYALWVSAVPGNEVVGKRRLARMEEAMEAFYYWFALQENIPIPPMPRYRLVGIMVNNVEDFQKKYQSWGPLPMVGEGFAPRRDNIMVIGAKRFDEGYALLEAKTLQWRKEFRTTPEELLNGDVFWKRPNAKAYVKPYAIVQTMEVVQKALNDESERTTISHAAVSQMLAASGILPHNVAAPEWLQEGLASYFERPFGAVYGAGGLPSWSNLVAFKFYRESGLGQARPVLFKVLSDQYFKTAREASSNSAGLPDPPTARIDEDWEKARSTAWALVYYLIKDQKMDRLLSYAKDISQMPRDFDMDERVLESTFAKAFGLADAKNPTRLDPARFQTFADGWFADMETVNLEVNAVQEESMKTRKANLPKKNGPASRGPQGKIAPPPPPPRN